MEGKPRLHYFNGRGRMECIRWLLAAAGVEVRCGFIQIIFVLGSLSGTLMYGQHLPMVETHGMNLVETRAILRYIPAKYDLYGGNLKEQAWIHMYVEGLNDLSNMIMFLPLSLPEEEMNLAYILEKATTRFFPVCEKPRKSHQWRVWYFLVCNWLSWADTQQPKIILMTEECKPSVLLGFPLLQKFKARSKSIETVKNTFKLERGMFLKNMTSTVAEY
uniref:glutathione transferase n=1 Tax=Theropithecus gelada TaxID=9565 RepID=A0A8D2EAV9_THEGE